MPTPNNSEPSSKMSLSATPVPQVTLPTIGQLQQGAKAVATNVGQVVTQSAKQVVTDATSKPTTPHGHRRKWLAVSLIILLVLVVAFAVYWWFIRPAQIAKTVGANTNSATLLYRASTMPSVTVGREQHSLAIESHNLPALPIDQYYYSLMLTTTQEGGAIQKVQDFIISDAGMVDLEGNPVEDMVVSDFLDYTRVRIALNGLGKNQGLFSIIAEGPLATEGDNRRLTLPIPLDSATGKVVSGADKASGEYRAGVELTGLQSLIDYGWTYDVWFVKMNGPYVERSVLAGSLDDNDIDSLGQIRKVFSSREDLTGFNGVVISLEPLDQQDETMFALRPFSGMLIWS